MDSSNNNITVNPINFSEFSEYFQKIILPTGTYFLSDRNINNIVYIFVYISFRLES